MSSPVSKDKKALEHPSMGISPSSHSQSFRITSMFSTLTSIPQRWRLLSGQNNWKNLLDPLDSDLQDYLIHYGAMCQATYDNFNANRESEYAGCSIYSRKNMFDKVGVAKGNPFEYRVVKYIYATSGISLPDSFLCKSLSGKAWSRDSNWIGYVAVATDEGKQALGRRDILVAWRGTVMPMEWVNDLEAPLVPATKILGKAGEHAHVHQGFLSLYVSNNEESPVSKTSARDQVLSEVQKQVDLYADEDISITVVGHSLGAAVSTINAVDIAYNRHNMPSSSRKNPCPVTAFNFGTPRSGDSNFKAIVDSLHDLRILKVSNVSDIVPRIPPFVYIEVGAELMVDSARSPYLKALPDFTSHHNLEVSYLHPLAIAKGLEIKRDIALVNKNIDGLKTKYLIPKRWWCQENNGMVQQNDGSWKLQDHEKDDSDS